MPYGIRLRVSGPRACFTRPEMKVERVSYDVMTPSAARGRPVAMVPPLVAAKLALHDAMLAAGVSNVELGRRLDLTDGAVRVAVHRLRQRYRQLLSDEIAQTVATPGEVRDELHYLLRVIAR